MKAEWEVVYEKAKRDDGSLFFPERLTQMFLDQARTTMGSYLYANQYQNEIIPDDERRFRKEWIRYYTDLPKLETYRFGFIDPAIGQKDHSDYTGIAIVHVDHTGTWWTVFARRERLTPTQIVNKCFELCQVFGLNALGIEQVAYQEALLYLADEEMKKRQMVIPIKGIPRRAITKETRILSLVPRFEWGRIYLAQGLTDLEDEYNTFPRGSHDDILDALASIDEIAFYPEFKEKKLERPHSPSDPNYEKWYIQQIHEHSSQGDEERG